jgi:hypothetical protein
VYNVCGYVYTLREEGVAAVKTSRLVLLAVLGLAVGVAASTDAQTVLLAVYTVNPQQGASFAYSLAAGEVNGDSREDIGAGAPGGAVGATAVPPDIAQTVTELYAPTEAGNAYTTPLVLNPDVAGDYPDASGTLTYYQVCNAFRGHIDATGLLPDFPYQLKIIGKPSCANAYDPPDDWGNEQLGPEGFWWLFSGGVQTDPGRKVYNDYEEYDDCGHGDDPLPDPDAGYRLPEVPHDFVPAQTEDWCYEGVIVFYGTMSDANGDISWDFVADWSYPHAPPEDNRDDHPFVLPNGPYNVRFVLNESAHNPVGYEGPPTAVWRGVLLDENNAFEISDLDSDGDGLGDGCDNCPETPNPNQTNTDVIVNPPGDALGDACDLDDDNDTVLDGDDADPLDPYVCRDLDTDSCDDCSVLGVADPSNDGTDTDSDGACDAGDLDDDNDTVLDGDDADPLDPYVCRDLDTDSCDDCSVLGVADPSNDGTDTDSDGACDAGDPDDDNDTVLDGDDTDPLDPYVCQDVDTDTCDDCSVLGQPDVSDDGTDTDADGACDAGDNCPLDYNPGQADADGDHWGDACDYCPTVATPWYTPAGDDDCDGFAIANEEYTGTDPMDPCPDALDDDAWPPDINGMGCGSHNGQVNILDVLCFKPQFQEGAVYDSRYDLNASGDVNILDVLLYKQFINTSCTNP